MSSINFNELANYYDAGYDFSSLLGGTTNSSGNLLGDYASIKNGSYGKLMKAYYAKQDEEKGLSSGDSTQKLTLLRSSADSLKKSAETLNSDDLWEKKKITKTDEETGEKTEVEDYDWKAITKAVKSFIEDYNSVIELAGDSETQSVLRNTAWMVNMTDKAQNLLSKAGINIGKGNKLELDEEVFQKADIVTLKSLFKGYGSYADRISQKAGNISNAAARTKGTTYTKKGEYSDMLSRLVSSKIDEKVGDKSSDLILKSDAELKADLVSKLEADKKEKS